MTPSSNNNACGKHSRDNKTRPNAPYTGSVKAMYRWADELGLGGGVFVPKSGWNNLVVAGSNTGANACTARKLSMVNTAPTLELGM